MVIAVDPTDLLVVHDWCTIRKIEDPNQANISKYWIARMPFFDEETFPFLVSAGYETFNLVNVKDFTQDVLIQATGKIFFSQRAAFFTIMRHNTFRMHFATRTITAENKRLKQWHSMNFKRDFIEVLKD